MILTRLVGVAAIFLTATWACGCGITGEGEGDEFAKAGKPGDALGQYELALRHVSTGSADDARIASKAALAAEKRGDERISAADFSGAAADFQTALTYARRANDSAEASRLERKSEPLRLFLSATIDAENAISQRQFTSAQRALASVSAEYRSTIRWRSLDEKAQRDMRAVQPTIDEAKELHAAGKFAESAQKWRAVLDRWADAPAAAASLKDAEEWADYQTHIEAAKTALGAGDVTVARRELTAAERIRRTEETARMTEALKIAGAFVEFNQAMNRAKEAQAAGQWWAAKQAFLRAIELAATAKTDATEARVGVAACNRELQADYQSAMQAGDTAAQQESWSAAEAAFERAAQVAVQAELDPAPAKAKVDEIRRTIARVAFEAAMQAGTAAEEGMRFADAISAFESAIGHAARAGLDPLPAVRRRDAGKLVIATREFESAATTARTAEASNRWPEAVEAWRSAIRIAEPAGLDATVAHAQLAQCLRQIAWQQFRSSLQIATDAQDKGDWTTAAEAYTKAAEFAPAAGENALEMQQASRRAAALAIYHQRLSQARQAHTQSQWASARQLCDEAILAVKGIDGVDPHDARELRQIVDQATATQFATEIRRAEAAESAQNWATAIVAYGRAIELAASLKMLDATAAVGNRARAMARAQFTEAIVEAQTAEKQESWDRAAGFYLAATRAAVPAGWAATEPGEIARTGHARSVALHEYTSAMQRAEEAVQNREFNRAIAAYREAAERAEAAGLPRQEADRAMLFAANRQQFIEAMLAGQRAEQAKQWTTALAAYRDAAQFALRANLRAGEAETAHNRVAARQRYFDAMAHGESAEAANNWAGATAAFREAARHERDADIPAGAAQAALQRVTARQNYTTAMQRGQREAGRNNWDAALAAYTEAVDHCAIAAISPVEARAEQARIRARKDYDAAMKAGRDAATAARVAESLLAYRQASELAPACGIDPKEPIKAFISACESRTQTAERAEQWGHANAIWKLVVAVAGEFRLPATTAQRGVTRTQEKLDAIAKLAAEADAARHPADPDGSSNPNAEPNTPADPDGSGGGNPRGPRGGSRGSGENSGGSGQ